MPSVRRRVLLSTVALASLAGGAALAAPSSATPTAAATHHPIFLPTIGNLAAVRAGDSPLTPPAPPCAVPQTSLPAVDAPLLGSTPDSVGPCVSAPETPATGAPFLGNMAYWGGPVQVHPHVYLVFFGWGENGAFKGACKPTALNEGAIKATLKCDPDGAGKRMADFVSQLGGTQWAGVQTQYYQIINGVKTYISNDKNQLAGIWVDDTNKTSAKISYHDMGAEAERAAAHFHVPASQLIDSNFVIAQPQNFSDPLAASEGYCAFHDLVEPGVDSTDYHGLTPGVPYTNMPYVLNNGTGCGENLINSGSAGTLDGFTVALGHEIEETVTDPGAEDHLGGVATGGWYDPFDANENGDKCAYVGADPTGLIGGSLPVPGAGGDIKGNRGGQFPVQSLWSNNAAGGAGYCAGAGTDLPA